MRKLPYQGGLTKLICQKAADIQKKRFMQQLMNSGRLAIDYKSKDIDYDIISFSGAAAFEDQVLSIYSLVVNAGVPKNWVIYSDKSYTQKHTDLIKKLFPFVTFVDWDHNDKYVNDPLLKDYAAKYPTAKKVNIIAGHQYERQTIYLDSDIVFYNNISAYLGSEMLKSGFWYVPDTLGDIKNYFASRNNSVYALNLGMLIVNEKFDFQYIFDFLEKLKGDFYYFADQDAFDYAFLKQNGQLLDPRQFIIDTGDQFDFETKYHPSQIAMRHYTGPVRHKMWQKGWKWHLQS